MSSEPAGTLGDGSEGGTAPSGALVSHTIEVPGAVLAYDVRTGIDPSQTPLVLIGSPMGASGFVSLAGHFTDRTVVTYDPRGVERSRRTDGANESTPELHADDLARLLEHLGVGPVDIFASSGGAVNLLALVAQRPDLVRTAVAHEPPLVQVLPDREAAGRVTRGVYETYQSKGLGPAMAQFIVLVDHQGEVPADLFAQGGPDPAMFGLPTEDDGRRDDALLGQNLLSCTHYEPDAKRLREVPTRLLIAAGEQSGEALAARAARALAQQLGAEPVMFPSHHAGFLGGEYGQMGEPEAFAARLREVLAGAS